MARPLVSTLSRSRLILPRAAGEERRPGSPPTAPTATAASVQRRLQRSAARTARPASRATKLDCEKVGDQPDPEDGDEAGQQRQGPAAPRPEQRRHRDHDHQRQVAPVDVRVPEDRVDPEVGVEFVRADHLVVPEEARGSAYSTSRPATKATASTPTTQRTSVSSRRSHSTSRSSAKTRENGTKKKQTFCSALGEVGRVERLQRVEDDDGGQDSREPDAAAGGLARSGGLRRRRAPRSPQTRRPVGQSRPQWRALRPRSPGRAAPAGSRCRRRRGAGPGTGGRRRSPAAAGSASGGRRGERGRDRDGGERQQGDEAGRVVAQVDDLRASATGRRGSGPGRGPAPPASPPSGRGPAAAGSRRRCAGRGEEQPGPGEEVAHGSPRRPPLGAAAAQSASRRGAVQADRPGRDQDPVLAEQFDPQLVAAGRRDAAAALAAVPVEGVEVVALEEAVAGEGDDHAAAGLDDLHGAVVGAGSSRKRIRIAVVAAVAVRGEAVDRRASGAGRGAPTKVTRSRTSGSRFSRCDQAKAATVARTRRAKTTAPRERRSAAHPPFGIVLADDHRDRRPRPRPRRFRRSSAAPSRCPAPWRPSALRGLCPRLNMTTLSSKLELLLVTAPSSKPLRSTLSP